MNSADIKLETDGEYNVDEDCSANSSQRYVAKQALKMAVIDWHEEFFEKCAMPRKLPMQSVYPVSFPALLSPTALLDPKTPISATLPMKGEALDPMTLLEVGDGYMKPAIVPPPVNSLLEHSSTGSTTSSNESAELNATEPMDCVVTPGSTPVESSIPHSDLAGSEDLPEKIDTSSPGDATTLMIVDVTDVTRDNFTISDISLLVDLFYLPFEHGRWAVDSLSEFQWLKINVLTSSVSMEWKERCELFLDKIRTMVSVIDRLCNVPNKALVHELFVYSWDIKTVLLLVGAFVQWLGEKELLISYCFIILSVFE